MSDPADPSRRAGRMIRAAMVGGPFDGEVRTFGEPHAVVKFQAVPPQAQLNRLFVDDDEAMAEHDYHEYRRRDGPPRPDGAYVYDWLPWQLELSA